jgi:hypothetical protein
MGLKEVKWEGVEWIYLAQDMDKRSSRTFAFK